MYADDTVFLAASTDDLQKNLNIFNIYCEAWKSKVVIFSKRKMKNPPVFTLNNEVIEIVDSYLYLGLIMNYNGSFEFHYLFKCQYFGNQRKIYIKKNIRINPNIIKFKLLMTFK